MDFKHTRGRVFVERGYVTQAGNCIREIHMDHPWFWLGLVPCRFWMAAADYIDTTDFYSIIHCSADKKFVGRRNHARRVKWTKLYRYLFWVDLTVMQSMVPAQFSKQVPTANDAKAFPETKPCCCMKIRDMQLTFFLIRLNL